MSIFEGAYKMAATKIKATKTWMAFDLTRRRTVRKVLLEACLASSDLLAANVKPDRALVEKVVDQHLESVAEAGLPVIELLKLFGVSSLMTIANAIDEGSDSA